MINIQGTVFEIFSNKMVTTNLGHPILLLTNDLFAQVYSEDSANSTSHYERLHADYDTYYDRCQRVFKCEFSFRDASSGLGPGRNVLNVTLYSESTQVTAHPLGYNVSTSLPDVILCKSSKLGYF